MANLVMTGKRSKEIASLLKISEAAVAFHRSNIRAKLELKRRRVNLVSHLKAMGGR